MSTFLVSFGVVAASVICVVAIVMGDLDQPATVRRPRGREPLDGRRGSPAPPSPRPARRDRRPAEPQPAGAWVRVRSGVTLAVLVAFVGVILAVMVGSTLALAFRALRRAVG